MTVVQELLKSPRQPSALFHMVNRIVPEDQVVLSVPPDTPAGEALRLMQGGGYSQLPVKQGASVLGLFSYRAFALEVAKAEGDKVDFLALPVEEFLEHEKPSYARLVDEFRGLIDVLDQKDSVVVSSPEELIAILTPMDVLRYLYSVANPFVLLEEIELALRSLILEAAAGERLQTCIATALAHKYKPEELPQRLEDMSFDDYVALVRDGRNWDACFAKAFGGTRERVRARLEPVRNLRNDVFHFRRELSAEDHEGLASCRGWLLRCVRKMDAKSRGLR
jgi:predicted transcriptional regulator